MRYTWPSMRSPASVMPRTRGGVRPGLFAVVAALGLSFTNAAWANDIALAEKFFKDGLKAMEANDYVTACKAFAGSNEADPSPGTLINLGTCQERQGKIASAWGSYNTAAGMADQRGQTARAQTARDAAAKIEPQLHKLVISLKVVPDEVVVLRNGVAVPKLALGAEIPVDPGEHVIEVTAKGKKKWLGRIVARPGAGVDRLEIPALVDEPVVVPPGGAPGGEVPQGSRGSTQRVVGGVVTGAGVVAGGVALGLQLLALSVSRDADKICALPIEQDPDRASCESKRSAAKTNQAGAIALGVTGVVMIGVGLTLFFTAPSGAPSPKTSVRFIPSAGPEGGFLSAVGTF